MHTVSSPRPLILLISLALSSLLLPGQQADPSGPKTAVVPQTEAKRLLWIIPNYRTAPTLKDFERISPKRKLEIARQDSFDRGTFALAALFGGAGQLSNSNPAFGQGVAGYGRYFATSYADFVIGDYMTEGIFPSLLHQDPRYFRKGTGGWSRLGYAAGQIFWTHTDTGKGQFNYSEILGNSTAVAIGNAYYTDNRTVANGISKLSSQLAVDMMSNILKEFWPEISRKFSSHRSTPADGR